MFEYRSTRDELPPAGVWLIGRFRDARDRLFKRVESFAPVYAYRDGGESLHPPELWRHLRPGECDGRD